MPPQPTESSTAKEKTPMYTIPITNRPSHGPIYSKIFFPILFNFGQIGINSAQILALPLLLIPFWGRGWFEGFIGWTKDGYGRLFLFAPTSLIITTDAPPSLTNLVERDAHGRMTKINLPDRLVVMANHQAYTDWMYLWILACYSGHSRGVIILLKEALKNIPVVGWGMRFFKFIFLARSWASDRSNLTIALKNLSANAKGKDTLNTNVKRSGNGNGSGNGDGNGEDSALLDKSSTTTSTRTGSTGRSPLWLFIFPEGTITSDEERVKSKRYADKEGIDDFKMTLHPRSTGLLFILRTLLPSLPDLQLLDVTIGYPGVPYGAYPQDYFGLLSIFYRSVPPPTVHLHLHLYSDLANGDIPSLITERERLEGEEEEEEEEEGEGVGKGDEVGLASPEEARAFELWLRERWAEKEKRVEGFAKDQKFGKEDKTEMVPIRQVRWYDWIGAVGGGGIMTVGLAIAIWRIVVKE